MLVETMKAWRITSFSEAASLPQLQSIPILLPFPVLLSPRPPPRSNPLPKHIDIPHQALHPYPLPLHLVNTSLTTRILTALPNPPPRLLSRHTPPSFHTTSSLKTADTAKSAKS
jgi:hypothetical protein